MFKTIWSEFKSFAFKGNMIDLAVAVVIGAAFSGVINSLVKDIIMPAVSYVVTAASDTSKVVEHAAKSATEKVGLVKNPETQPASQPSTQPTTESAVPAAPPEAAVAAAPAPAPAPAPTPAAAASDDPTKQKAVQIDLHIGRIMIGNFIAELINFVIIAFAVFIIIVKVMGSAVKRMSRTPEPSEPTTKECPECLSMIPYRAKRCSHCTTVLPPPPAPNP